MTILANFSMLGLLTLGAMAWGFARVLDAPRGAVRAIPLVIILVALASQLALPPEAPFRQSVNGALRFGVYVAIVALPVLGYRVLLRRLRAKSGAVPEPKVPKTGFVLIDEDEALVRDTRAALNAEFKAASSWAPEEFSIAHRDATGTIDATARIVLNLGLADIHAARVVPGPDAAARAAALLEEVEAEVRRRGATRIVITLHDWQADLCSATASYREIARVSYPAGPTRLTLEKDLG